MKAPINLDPPGAGIPKWRLFFMKPLFLLASARVPREKFDRLYKSERQKILGIVNDLSPALGERQTLVSPLMGIEDSSRFWSVYMTLQHLSIVDQGLTGIIKTLSSGGGDLPEVKVENVKPSEEAGEDEIRAFEKTSKLTTHVLSKIHDFPTNGDHHHPWFGPLTAKRWHALRAIHLKIHRRQIEAILKSASH